MMVCMSGAFALTLPSKNVLTMATRVSRSCLVKLPIVSAFSSISMSEDSPKYFSRTISSFSLNYSKAEAVSSMNPCKLNSLDLNLDSMDRYRPSALS